MEEKIPLPHLLPLKVKKSLKKFYPNDLSTTISVNPFRDL